MANRGEFLSLIASAISANKEAPSVMNVVFSVHTTAESYRALTVHLSELPCR